MIADGVSSTSTLLVSQLLQLQLNLHMVALSLFSVTTSANVPLLLQNSANCFGAVKLPTLAQPLLVSLHLLRRSLWPNLN